MRYIANAVGRKAVILYVGEVGRPFTELAASLRINRYFKSIQMCNSSGALRG